MNRSPVKDDLRALLATPRRVVWLSVILLGGLLVRVPGVFWGANFPLGWAGHHPDEFTHLVNAEMLIDPSSPPRWEPHPYPKGTAGLAAAPIIAARVPLGNADAPLPRASHIITWGRLVSVVFGTLTALVVALLALRIFGDVRVALTAGTITALGGLHVTQSHFFLADVPGLFWFLLALYLLLIDLDGSETSDREALQWAALASGVAFGTKFLVAGLPTLGIAALARGPRLRRLVGVGVFAAAGFAVVNLFSFTLAELYDALVRGVGDPYAYSRWFGALLYLLELPSVISLPVTVFGLLGGGWLAARYVRLPRRRQLVLALVILLPFLANLYLIVFKVDHFPRHLVQLLPWLILPAAWALVRTSDAMAARGIARTALIVPFFAYLAAFVVDGERVFIQDPRNEAARWVMANVPEGGEFWWNRHPLRGYRHLRFPERGRAPVLVIEMLDANHYLSGIGWRDSYPDDARNVFDAVSQERVEVMQALHRGILEYREVARFPVGYIMPEYVLTDRLIGDRSRNYVTDVVIFRRTETPSDSTHSGGGDEP